MPAPQSLWIERTTLTLTHSLPGISRWFEVERRELVSQAAMGRLLSPALGAFSKGWRRSELWSAARLGPGPPGRGCCPFSQASTMRQHPSRLPLTGRKCPPLSDISPVPFPFSRQRPRAVPRSKAGSASRACEGAAGPVTTRCPVCQVEVSPLENAIQVVENKNQELRALIGQYQHKQVPGNIGLLSMCLNGVIDAAVNGGIARYQEVRGRPTAPPRDSFPAPLRSAWLAEGPGARLAAPLPVAVAQRWEGPSFLFSELCQIRQLLIREPC